MVHLICQIDYITKYPEFWSNIILSVAVRIFLDEINI